MFTIMAVGAGVERVLGEVERDVVGAEPADAVDHEAHPVAAGRPDPAALHGDQDAEGDDPDEQASQREGSAADLGSDTADHHERARPRQDRERDRPQQEDALTRGGGRGGATVLVDGVLVTPSR